MWTLPSQQQALFNSPQFFPCFPNVFLMEKRNLTTTEILLIILSWVWHTQWLDRQSRLTTYEIPILQKENILLALWLSAFPLIRGCRVLPFQSQRLVGYELWDAIWSWQKENIFQNKSISTKKPNNNQPKPPNKQTSLPHPPPHPQNLKKKSFLNF